MPNVLKVFSKVIQKQIGDYSVFALNLDHGTRTQVYPLVVENNETETLVIVPISYEGDLGLTQKWDLSKDSSFSAFPELNIPIRSKLDSDSILKSIADELGVSDQDISEIVIGQSNSVVLATTHKKVRSVYVFLKKNVDLDVCDFIHPVGYLFKHVRLLNYVDIFSYQALMNLIFELKLSPFEFLNEMSGPFIQGVLTKEPKNPHQEKDDSKAYDDWYEGRGFALQDQGMTPFV